MLIFSFIPILLAIGVGYKFYKSEAAKDTLYRAKISFIETDQISSASSGTGAARFPGLGGKIGTGSASATLEGILRSDLLLEKALFMPVSERETELLLNLYFRSYFPDEFDEIRVGVTEASELNQKQRRYYSRLKNIVDDENESLIFVNQENILSMSVLSVNEDLSYAFANNLYNALSDFYRKSATEVYDITLAEMTRVRDSTFRALKAYERQLAQVETSQNFEKIPTEQIPNINLVEKIRLTQQRYYYMYSEVDNYRIRNKLSQDVFKLLSEPLKPLPKTVPDARSKAIIGGVVGLLAGLFLLILIYILRVIYQLYKKLNLETEPEEAELATADY